MADKTMVKKKTTKKKALPSYTERVLDFSCHLRGWSVLDHLKETDESEDLMVGLACWVMAPSRKAMLLFLCQNDLLRLVDKLDDDYEKEDYGITEQDFETQHDNSVQIIVDRHGRMVSFCRKVYPGAKTIDDIRRIWEVNIAAADRFLASRTISDLEF
jgi:hypothetical protein